MEDTTKHPDQLQPTSNTIHNFPHGARRIQLIRTIQRPKSHEATEHIINTRNFNREHGPWRIQLSSGSSRNAPPLTHGNPVGSHDTASSRDSKLHLMGMATMSFCHRHLRSGAKTLRKRRVERWRSRRPPTLFPTLSHCIIYSSSFHSCFVYLPA